MASKRQNDRLLKVAKALREHPAPKRFSMKCYINGDEFDRDENASVKEEWCGTPACALGTYASRPDLQRFLRIETNQSEQWDDNTGDWVTRLVPEMVHLDGDQAYFDSEAIETYFGLDGWGNARELFGPDGCGGAKTPKAAAKYIERFVAKRS